MIVPSLGISAAIVVACFAVLYLPTAAVLSVVQLGPLGFVTAVSVVLSVAGTPSSLAPTLPSSTDI
jgi:hypothetical protein